MRAILLALGLAGCNPGPEGEDTVGESGDSGADSGAVDTADTADTAEDTGFESHAPDDACDTPGCLRSLRSYGEYDRAAIEPYLAPGVDLENGYEIVVIEYLTAEDRTATATVTLPIDLAGSEPPLGFPVVVNAHGTVGLEDPCRLSGTVSGTGLAALFGGRGAIGVAPDYVGLGSAGVHRYLDAYEEATAVLDSVRAAIQLAHHRVLPTSERAAIVGLSQGGHAALAAAMWHSRYAPELDIRAFAASGPASVFEEHWAAGVTYPGGHQVMHAMMVWSFAEAAGLDATGDIWAADVAGTVEERLTTRCTWSPSFTDELLMGDGFPTEPLEVFSEAFFAEYSSGEWDRWALIHERFEANRIRPWLADGEQTAPIAIWQGTLDSTVLPYMTQELVDELQAGGIDVELNLVPGGEHTTTAFGFLAYPELATDESVAWVRARLEE